MTKFFSAFLRSPIKLPALFLVLFFTGMSGFGPKNSFLSSFMGQSMAGNTSASMLISEEKQAYLTNEINRVLTSTGFNGTVLVSRFGIVLYKNAFGHRAGPQSEEMNLETSFQVASISKTFTAAAVLMLQEEGLLSINDYVVKHIPEFPYPNITIQHLLTHTSGLQNYFWLLERMWNKPDLPDNEDVLNLFVRAKRPLNFTPGHRFEYSNTGYVFLGLLIERVSGISYSEFIHQRIFNPLGMTRSYVYDLHRNTQIENRAYGFRQSRGHISRIPDDIADGPLGDKGIFSTVGDLLKWDQAIHNNALLPAEVWRQAFTHARLNNNTPINYGHGWRLQPFLDTTIVHHPGRWRGFRTSLKRFPHDHSTIIVLSNNDRNTKEITDQIRNIIFAEEQEIWQAGRVSDDTNNDHAGSEEHATLPRHDP